MLRSLLSTTFAAMLIIGMVWGQCANCASIDPAPVRHDCCPRQTTQTDHCGKPVPPGDSKSDPCKGHLHVRNYDKPEFDGWRFQSLSPAPLTAAESLLSPIRVPENAFPNPDPPKQSTPGLFVLHASFLI